MKIPVVVHLTGLSGVHGFAVRCVVMREVFSEFLPDICQHQVVLQECVIRSPVLRFGRDGSKVHLQDDGSDIYIEPIVVLCT